MQIKKSSLEQNNDEVGGAYISNRLRNPNDEVAVNSVGNEMIYGIAAIIATVAMIVVAATLYLNLAAFTRSGLFVQ